MLTSQGTTKNILQKDEETRTRSVPESYIILTFTLDYLFSYRPSSDYFKLLMANEELVKL